MPTHEVVLSEEQRVELSGFAQSRSLPAGYVFRTRLILMLAEATPGQWATVLAPALLAKILSTTRKRPNDGSTHWSCRKLAMALGVSKDAIHRTWKEAGLKPHDWNGTWPATIRTMKLKPPISSACT
jgi:hypothetical protein